MSHSPNISEDGLNGLLDHEIAQAKTIAKLDALCWYALEILTEADRIYCVYGPPPAPEDELRPLLEMIRHFRLTAPAYDGAPTTPDGAVEGEAAAPSGSASDGIDVGAALEIGDPFAGLDVTDDIDGRDAA